MLFSCNYEDRIQKKDKASNLEKNQVGGALFRKESFETFFTKFHTDSSFQLDRIKFPLLGYTNDYEVEGIQRLDKDTVIYQQPINIQWQRGSWKLHHPLEDTNTYKIEKRYLDSTTIIERIYIPNSDFDIKRIFNIEKDKWYLIYYSEFSL